MNNSLRVLEYHRVADPKASPVLDPRLISATPETFNQQMRHLARHYQVVSLEDVLEAAKNGTRLPNRAVLITFDDAYCDLTEYAWPILKRFRLPATIFVPTAYPGRPDLAFWWDRLYRAFSYTSLSELRSTPIGSLPLGTSEERLESLRIFQNHVKTIAHADVNAMVDEICFRLGGKQTIHKSTLNWEELRQLVKEGATLGAHTQTHPILTQLPPEQIREEVIGSQQDLKCEIGTVLPIFCYPDGAHDEDVINILHEEGFLMAFTDLDGHNDMSTADYLRLRRTPITRRTSLTIFRLRLLRLGSYIDMWRYRKKQGRQKD